MVGGGRDSPQRHHLPQDCWMEWCALAPSLISVHEPGLGDMMVDWVTPGEGAAAQSFGSSSLAG